MIDKKFLHKMASQLFSKYGDNLSELVIVFPSRRSHVFFSQELSKLINSPIWLPRFYSIDDFILVVNQFQSINKLELFFDFYNIYKSTIRSPQPIDKCYKWANSLLEDFNDIDKSSVNYSQLFSYLSDVKRIDNWKLELDTNMEYINQYLDFFSDLKLVYKKLKDTLLKKKLVYPGLAHRVLAAEPNLILDWLRLNNKKKIIFIGIDALTISQEKIINYLLDQNICDIFWDADDYFVNNPKQVSGTFLRKYRRMWPGKFSNLSHDFVDIKKNINIIGTTKNVNQAKLLGTILSKEKYHTRDLRRIAIVLTNENLLLSVLESLPSYIKDINITMGYKLSNHPIVSIYNDIIALYISNVNITSQSKSHNDAFSTKAIIQILLNPFFKMGVNDIDSLLLESIIKDCRNNSLKHLSPEYVLGLFKTFHNPTIKRLFSSANIDSHILIEVFSMFTKNILQALKKDNLKHSIELECLFEIDTHLQYFEKFLGTTSEIIDVKLFSLLFNQLIKSIKLQFSGEPLKGIQIMGILETRTIDFDEVIILSANEGFLPPSSNTSSFIPFDIKSKFHLSTDLDNDIIYSNHFFNLITRPYQSTIIYDKDNSSTSFSSGEKSRFISQLLYEVAPFIETISVKEEVSLNTFSTEGTVDVDINNKDRHALQKLNLLCVKGLSPSSINLYNYCPKQFYFEKILGLYEPKNSADNIDNATMGSIIHRVLERLYRPFIDCHLNSDIMKVIISKMSIELTESLNYFDIKEIKRGKNVLILEAIKRILKNFILYESKLIQEGNSIIIKLLEYESPLQLISVKGLKEVNIKGHIDRVDVFNGTYRVIDYKTGSFQPAELKCMDLSEIHNKPKLLQLLLYAWLFHKQNINHTEPILSGIINLRASSFDFHKCHIKKSPFINKDVYIDFETNLALLIGEMFDKKTSFSHLSRIDECRYCD